MAEQPQPFTPPSVFEDAIFSAPAIRPEDFQQARVLRIEGFDYSRNLPWNDPPLHRVPQTYKDRALQPRYLRAPNGGVDILLPHKIGVAGKASLLHEWLNGKKRSDGPGNFAEHVTKDIFQTMADAFGNTEDFCIEPAPPQFDGSNRKNGDKGGDLLLIKDHKDGTSTIVCLIDVKTSLPTHTNQKGETKTRKRNLRSGMNRRLSYPIPVIVVRTGGINISTVSGRQYPFLDYLNGPVFQSASQDMYTELLDIDPTSYDELFRQIREEVHRGCIATKSRIQESAPDRMTLDRMLYQLALTDKILGIRQ